VQQGLRVDPAFVLAAREVAAGEPSEAVISMPLPLTCERCATESISAAARLSIASGRRGSSGTTQANSSPPSRASRARCGISAVIRWAHSRST
jgi:hypothetical protein